MSRPRSSKGASKRKAREKRPARAPGPGKSGRDGRRANVTPLVRVTGLGGVFFRSEDPKKLMGWYRKHLGIKAGAFGGWAFQWREKRRSERIGYTVFSPFAKDSPYFDPSEKPFMFNFRVADLHALIAQLRREGIHVLDDVQELPYGKFGWIIDPDGNKIELWEPSDVDDPFDQSEV
jgi:predicted enzyme related to lactoylglutathione lyase